MSFLVAAIQTTAELGAAELNRRKTLDLAVSAINQGARLIVFPELSISGYSTDAEILEAAGERLDGPTYSAWHSLAARKSVLVAGGFCEIEDDRFYNSAILIGPDGLLAHYRKLHLFDQEKLVFTPGNRGLPVADTVLGRIGLCVCYDLRFVEVLRALALRGADIVVVPTAWVSGFDPNPRDATGLIGQARGVAVQANLNQVHIACASQSGCAGGRTFLGSSLVADPYGNISAGPLDDQQEGFLIAEIDLDAAKASRVRSPLIQPRRDRRTDVYGLHIGGKIY